MSMLEEVADTAREIGSPDVITIHADVSKVDDCSRLVEETMDHFGRCKEDRNLLFSCFLFLFAMSYVDLMILVYILSGSGSSCE